MFDLPINLMINEPEYYAGDSGLYFYPGPIIFVQWV